MKKIQCDMCGSNDIVKQEGLFVCQYCGCKYTLEEAKKMMADGLTVKVDVSELTGNYKALANDAYNSGNYVEAEKYCNKYMESDMNDPEVWFLKGQSIGQQAFPGKDRLYETLNAFAKAIELCDEDKKEKMISESQLELAASVTLLLNKRINMLSPSPSMETISGLKSDISLVRNFVRDSYIKAHIRTFGIVNTRAAKIINKGIYGVWIGVLSNYSSKSILPTVWSHTVFLTEGNLLIETLGQAISLCNPPADSVSSEIICETYDIMIEIQKELLASGESHTSYINNLPIQIGGTPLSPYVARNYRERIRIWEDLKKECSNK